MLSPYNVFQYVERLRTEVQPWVEVKIVRFLPRIPPEKWVLSLDEEKMQLYVTGTTRRGKQGLNRDHRLVGLYASSAELDLMITAIFRKSITELTGRIKTGEICLIQWDEATHQPLVPTGSSYLNMRYCRVLYHHPDGAKMVNLRTIAGFLHFNAVFGVPAANIIDRLFSLPDCEELSDSFFLRPAEYLPEFEVIWDYLGL